MRAGKKKRGFIALLTCACMLLALPGCGEEAVTAQPGDVELLEPEGVAVSYELAAYRDLYDAKTYNALVCPYVEEYTLDKEAGFDSFGALPGDEVKAGQELIRTNTSNLDRQIKDMKKTIADQEKSYREYLQDANEALKKPLEDEKLWGDAVKNWAKEKPAEDSEDYEKWLSDNEFYEAKYGNALISVQKQKEAIRQRTGLYELDAAHNKVLLNRLQEDKRNNTLLSKMDGVVTSTELFVTGSWISTSEPIVAVADIEKKRLRSEYVNKSDINRAEEVYAIVGGKRYEVVYEPIEMEEYTRLSKLNGVVYSTFYPQGDISGIEMGDYGVIVVVRKRKMGVLTVPKDAVTREEGNAYVYVLNGTDSVYTLVQTGMDDGMYIEILDGVNEGDKILTETATIAAKKTKKLQRGTISNEFKARGNLAYPTRQWITNPIEYGTAYFVEGCVSLNQQVKKGDVLARISVKPDNVELDRNVKKLQRERERLAELQKDSEKNERAIASKQETIKDLEEVIAKMRKDFATTEILAPYDGIVVLPNSWSWQMPFDGMKEGAMLYAEQRFLMLAESSSNYIVVNDENRLLTYGNIARIEGRSGMPATGMVVTLNAYSINKPLLNVTDTLVKVSEEDIGALAGSELNNYDYWSRSAFDVIVTTRKMEDVLLVPKEAVVAGIGVTYVKLVKDNGEVFLQSFVAGGADSKNYWVAEGLTEGMEVCTE